LYTLTLNITLLIFTKNDILKICEVDDKMKVNGFTLIELLAVIVILAIISLIAIPTILNIIKDTNISAAKRSVENYIDAVELYLARSELDTNKVTLQRGNKYNVTNSTTIGEKTYPKINDLVEISGSKPTGTEDYVQLNQKGKVTDAKLSMNGYNVEVKDGNILSATKGELIAVENMTINITEQTMEKDSTFKLLPIFTPNNASNQEVTYKSEDTNIVKVDNLGNVTAMNTGNTKVIVTSKENSSIKAECNITVIVSAKGLTISPEIVEIKTEEEVQLIGTINPSNVTTNSLVWRSSNADIANVDANGKVTSISKGEAIITATTVNGIEATATIIVKELEPSVPKLTNNLIPVVYKNNNWKVADLNSKWYDYSNQEWANAVILNTGVTKNVGDTVNVSSEIKGMFVYIPRYEYKIEGPYGKNGIDSSTPGKIKIDFITEDTTTPSKGYSIPSAFNFGGTELSGIWVGKFETTGSVNEPTVLPNLTTIRSQTVNAQLTTAQKFNTYINNSNMDFHMAKNSEWGVAAYLSQSKYGKYGNSNYIGSEKQVMINNCSNYITGVGADSQDASESSSTCTTNTYETAKGQAASTTGNITGIYDMAGGSWEYVMGVYNKTVGDSGISTWPNVKYYDNYTNTALQTACNGEICYGHALSETSGWYNDYAYTFDSTKKWFIRGGRFGNKSSSGIFGFYCHTGGSDTHTTFRMALAIY